MLVSRAAIGDGSRYQGTIIDLVMETASSAGGFDIADLFPSFKFLHVLLGSASKLKKMHQKLEQILDNIINEHIENLGASSVAEKDLIDVLLRLKENGGL